MKYSSSSSPLTKNGKPLGAYLVEAGLLSEAQVGVALADQDTTALPFGEIVVKRGWVKEQTIEYLMQKVIMPERSVRNKTFSELEAGLVRQKVTFGSRRQERLTRQESAKPAQKSDDPSTGISWIG